MARGGVLAALGLALDLALGAGCHPCDLAQPVRPAAPQLQATTRGKIAVDVSALPTAPAKPPARPEQYRRLTAADCRALAIANAPLAADLDSHPASDAPAHLLAHQRSAQAEMSRQVRGFAADEIRNRAAADALDDYFKLAAAEGQFDLAANGHGVLTKQLSAAEKAIQQGLKDRGDVNAIRRQLFEIESQAAKLEAGLGALNASLGGRLGLDPSDPAPLWPADPLRVAAEEPNTEHALATALKYRPDLNLLRSLASNDDPGGEMANAVLNGINPLLGNTTPTHPLFILLAAVKHDPTRVEATTRRQLLGALATRERQAEAEVRAAIASLHGARVTVTAKAAEVRNLTARVGELEKREAAGQQVTAELAAMRLDLLKVRGELIQSVADWHIADVKLRQVMGLLVRE